MHQVGDQINLVIADNGIGIDNTLINAATDSLGLQLIKGLSKELKASTKFENNGGTRISIVFKLYPLNSNENQLTTLQEKEVYA